MAEAEHAVTVGDHISYGALIVLLRRPETIHAAKEAKTPIATRFYSGWRLYNLLTF